MNTNQLREDAFQIFQAGLDAVNPAQAVKRHLQVHKNSLSVSHHHYPLSRYQNIYLIGAGKASAAMAQPLEEALGSLLASGFINVKYRHSLPLKRVQVKEAGHPLPDEAGIKGTREIVDLLKKSGEKDLVIFLISGGGSALLTLPVEGISLDDLQQVTQTLLRCGASIHEINAVRKHISQVKGGHLARLAYPSTLISLILSDVIGDDLDTIASGPTVPDKSTFRDCLQILDKYGIRDQIPSSVLLHLEKGLQKGIKESPKKGNPAFTRTQNVIVGSNRLAVEEARKKSELLGYNSLILSAFVEGETREIAKMHAAVAKEIRRSGNPLSPPACVISGGETTVTVKGEGFGGRNQEFVLSSAIEIKGWKNVVVLSAGTDGTDGPTDAAGAFADGETVQRGLDLGLDPYPYLKQNDSYNFFKPLEDLIITGPTYTNVMDLHLVMVGAKD
ncbi:glycerate kinase [bacterium]|nr:glycerate kinase [bacterium]